MKCMKICKSLTIAGSDSGGGAGVQADLKTFHELGVYGMSAITALTAQNTLGVQGVYPTPLEGISQQIDSVACDLEPDSIKLGMLFNAEIIKLVVEKIVHYQWGKVVVDPVMIAKGGASLLQEEAIESVRSLLLPHAFIVTPNIPEAEVLTGMKIETMEERKQAAILLYEFGSSNVLIKGGHDSGSIVIDLLFDGKEFTEYSNERIHTKHTHGTGCTFSAAIAAELAKGKGIKEAVAVAKEFIHAAITFELGIGAGHGPTNHWAFHHQGLRNL
jgi:hydroxymethylpyrimidine/phosphomethylpyrimidine kinase